MTDPTSTGQPPIKTSASCPARQDPGTDAPDIDDSANVVPRSDLIASLRSKRGYTQEYVAEASKDLRRNDPTLRDLSVKFVSRAETRIEPRNFGKIRTLARILEVAPHDLIYVPEPADPGNARKDGSGQGRPDAAIMTDLISDILTWTRLAWIAALAASMVYAAGVAVGLFDLMRFLFPAVSLLLAILAGSWMRKASTILMPVRLRLMFGLNMGVMMGMFSLFALTLIDPDNVSSFTETPTRIAVGVFVVMVSFAFSAGWGIVRGRRGLFIDARGQIDMLVAICATGLVSGLAVFE